MLKWKLNPLSELKKAGYTQRDLQTNGSTLQALRRLQTNISLETIDKICILLDCQPGDLLEYFHD